MTSLKLTLARLAITPLAALGASALLLTGCGNMATTASDIAATGASTMSGRVHGGNQPVAGATVKLYAVGQTGVGSSPVLYAQTTTASDGAGSFRFVNSGAGTGPSSSPSTTNTYSCTSSGNDVLLYLYTNGGNTTGNLGVSANNTSASFLAPIGYCRTLTSATFTDVSEVSTAATAAAFAQFINPSTDGIGNDGTGVGYEAISNALKTYTNLVTAATGLSNSTTTVAGSGTGVSGVTMTVTSPAATVNTVANILSACVNQATGGTGNCTTLFNAAVPPSNAARTSQPSATFATATDTIQAALYMFLNPTDGMSSSNRTTLFNLQAASGAPYQTPLGAAPANWTLAISYSTNSLCSSSTPGASSAPNFLAHPYDLRVDPNGNLWIANKAGTNGAMVEMSTGGQALTCLPGPTAGESPSFWGGGVVDSAINTYSIWFTDYTDKLLFAYTPSSSTLRSVATAYPPLAIAADQSGNIFFSTVNGTPGVSGTVGSVYEIVNANNNASSISSPVLLTTAAGIYPARMFSDAANDIWVTSGGGFVTELSNSTAPGSVNNYLATSMTVTGPTYGVQTGPNYATGTGVVANSVWISSQDSSSTVTILTPTSGTTYSVATTAAGNVGGLNMPTGTWLDGAQNLWAANGTAETSGQFSVSAVAVDGTAVTPTGTNGGYQSTATYLNAPRGLLVDPVGNVWVTSDNNANSITQLVGAAVPINGPPSQATGGRFQNIP